MQPIPIVLACVTPYLVAICATLVVQRVHVLPPHALEATLRANAAGRMTGRQRWSLLVYAAPELVFSLTALLIALVWQPNMGLSGTALRWGLAGMALVRIGISLPTWRDVFSGRVQCLAGPLRKIQFGRRCALATEDGPIVVLPVERTLFDAQHANEHAAIYFAPSSKRVVAVHQPHVEAVVEHANGVPQPA